MRVRSFIQYNCPMGLSFRNVIFSISSVIGYHEIGRENGSKFVSQNLSHKEVRHNTGPASRGAEALAFPEQRLVIETQFKLLYRVPLCFSHLAKLFELYKNKHKTR